MIGKNIVYKGKKLEYHDALTDLLMRQLVIADEPVTSKELRDRTGINRAKIVQTLEKCDDARLTDEHNWEVKISG